MYKKFLSAIVLVFAFLFLNVSVNSFNIQAEENTLPEQALQNAGKGKYYWAMVNYGDDYIGDSTVTINIQREAINNQEIQFIVITETGYLSDTYFQRNVSANFSSTIEYTFENKNCGKKSVTILLLRELAVNPSEELIVDKIIIDVDQKSTICSLTAADFNVEQNDNPTKTEAEIRIGLASHLDVNEYALEKVTYRLKQAGFSALNAIPDGYNVNEFYFNTQLNGEYEIIIQDAFNCTKTIEFVVSGLTTPPIYIKAIPSATTPVNHGYQVVIEVYQTSATGDLKLSSSSVDSLEYSYEGGSKVSIKSQMYIFVEANGVYEVTAKVKNSTSTLEILIDNIDLEKPYAEVSDKIEVLTESVNLFDPRKEIFVYDNMTSGDELAKNIEITYYEAKICGKVSCLDNDGRLIKNSVLGGSYTDYLYTVRDLIVEYRVTDEAGWSITKTTDVYSIDNTKPTVESDKNRIMLYINDPSPGTDYLIAVYGINVRDNSLYPGSGRDEDIQFTIDPSELPVDKNGRLNELGNYRIFLRATDGSNNVSDEIVLNAEVRQRVIKIEADLGQYILYGDRAPEDIVISYKCLVEEFIDGAIVTSRVDCSTQLLEGDYIIGQLYVVNAKYVDQYDIYYDRIKVPNQLYYLDYGDVNIKFNIYPRKVKVQADRKEKFYLDEDPELTYTWGAGLGSCTTSADTRKEGYVYNPNPTKEYRCDLVDGDSLYGDLSRYEGLPYEAGVTIWQEGINTEIKEFVWFDGNNNVVSRPIYQNELYVRELDDGGHDDNYLLEFTEGEFYIYPTDIVVDIANSSKTYGELDPKFEIAKCTAYVRNEFGNIVQKDCRKDEDYGIVLKRDENNQGENVGTYEINGTWSNKNYNVSFHVGYLTINRRDITIKVQGDKDEEGFYTGKYTIYYEDSIPEIKVYDGTAGVSEKGLVYSEELNIADEIYYGKADVYSNCNGTCSEHLVTDYDRVGIYIIKRGTISVKDKDGHINESNYNISFENGQLEVIKKEIQIRILESLSKIYGEEDKKFNNSYLNAYYKDKLYIILEANGRYVIEITNKVALDDGSTYIPRDNKTMKYHINREQGIFVGQYDIFIEELEGCENYDVYLLEDYKYTINQKPLTITMGDANIIYRETELSLSYSTSIAEGEFPYGDKVVGMPNVSETSCYVGVAIDGLSYCNVRSQGYKIGKGNITVVDEAGTNDVSFNYAINYVEGTLMIDKRVIIITALGGEKEYGYSDPDLPFVVYHKENIPEELPTDQYTGGLGREAGETPGEYQINKGTIVIQHYENGVWYENYYIDFENSDFNNKFIITKRKLTISVKNKRIEAIYGDVKTDYFEGNTSNEHWEIKGGKTLANNPDLYIDGVKIADTMKGSLVIENAVADEGGYLGAGTYTVNCNGLRIYQNSTEVDVTDLYYEITYENGVLDIQSRHITITPVQGLSKVYGENDPDLGPGVAYTWDKADIMLESDKVVGNLIRLPNEVNGELIYEDAGTYSLSIAGISVQTKHQGDRPNYTVGISTSSYFIITIRNITVEPYACRIETNEDGEEVCTITNTIEYGDAFKLDYVIGGDGLANNQNIGVVDYANGEVILDPTPANINKPSVGTYNIIGNNITISNSYNYVINYVTGKKLYVEKKKLYITVDENALSKIYGEADPEFTFTTNIVGIGYSGSLKRDPGEDVGSYDFVMDDIKFDVNYEVMPITQQFVIEPKVVEVIAKNSSKIFGAPKESEILDFDAIGIDKSAFTGALSREPGEAVGKYKINQGSLQLNKNYIIRYTPAIFEIYYLPLTEIIIVSKNNNKYQVQGKESEVELYATFNEGADTSHIKDVKWRVVKRLKNGSEFECNTDGAECTFYVNGDNEISFFPSGEIGTYAVSASYGGIAGYYDVIVDISTITSVYIEHDSGAVEQVLGWTEPVTYKATVLGLVNADTEIAWLVNGVVYTIKKLTQSNTFTYLPSNQAGQYGEFLIQAQVVDKISEAMKLTVRNNNAPIITLNGSEIEYIEARSGKKYIEAGATAYDDYDSTHGIAVAVHITGYVDENTKGTYYIKYDAVDSHGNHAISVYRQVIVRDTIAPKVTLIGEKNIRLSYGETFEDPGAYAIDNYDGEVEVIVSNPIVPNQAGTFIITYYAYDESNNRGSATRYVEVVDDVPPVITLMGNAIMNVEVNTTFEDPGALVEDNVDGKFYISASKYVCNGVTSKTLDTSKIANCYAYYEYTDTSGNSGVTKVREIIIDDTTAPVITLNGVSPHIVRYSYPTINYEEPGAVATDNYDKEVEVVITGTIGRELGSYSIYYNATDSRGNKAKTVIREVVVVDIENPVINFLSACPQYMVIEALYEEYNTRCNQPGYGFWVEDDYKEDIEGIQQRVVVKGTVDSTTKGTYIITYDVQDMAGNAAVTLRRYVRVVDTTAPVITLLGGDEKDGRSQTVEVFEEFIDLGIDVYERYDTYHELETTITISHNVNVSRLGEYTITYNAVDTSGNKAIPVIRKVYVKDTKAPVITIEGKNPYIIERGTPYRDDGATAMDNYDRQIMNISVHGIPSGMILGTFEVVYRAVDSSGNVGEAIRIVIVQDTKPPVVLGVEDGAYYKDPVSIYFIPTLGTDEVLTGWLNGEEISSPKYVEKEGTYHLVVRDDAGNETSLTFYIDRTPPVILGVKNNEYTNREVVEIYANEKIKYFEYRYQTGEWIRVEEQRMSVTEEGTYRIYAVDMAGNESEVITFVVDRTMPKFSLTGVLNKGITDTNVHLITEDKSSVIVNAKYSVETTFTFTNDGYYQISIMDLASNTVNLQFVINKTNKITVDGQVITILSQHNAIDKIQINGNYPRSSGYMLVIPLTEGGFKYVSGKLFSEAEYQTLISGGTVEFGVSPTDDTYMFAAFVVESSELNKFGTQTVEGDEDDRNLLFYIVILIALLLLIGLFFIIFLKRRKEEEDEEEAEEIVDEY